MDLRFQQVDLMLCGQFTANRSFFKILVEREGGGLKPGTTEMITVPFIWLHLISAFSWFCFCFCYSSVREREWSKYISSTMQIPGRPTIKTDAVAGRRSRADALHPAGHYSQSASVFYITYKAASWEGSPRASWVTARSLSHPIACCRYHGNPSNRGR